MHPSVKKYVTKSGPVNPKLIDLLTNMLSADITARPESVQNVLQHAFFEEAEDICQETLEQEFRNLVDTQ